jgi:N-acetylglucosaminyl-diphospho-decaprenol L-rhamnosyltransferase
MIPSEDQPGPPVPRDFDSSAIVVVNYGSHELLARNLAAVSTGAPGILVVVVDNFTTAEEQEQVRALSAGHGWMAVFLPENRGFGVGVNVGADAAIAAGRTVLAVLNPDATIDRDSLERLTTAAAADLSLMVAPVIRRPDGSVWHNGSDLYLADGRMGNPRRRSERSGIYREWLSGACFALSADLWRRVGGFDDDYFLYWEDVDLSFRVVEAGGRLAIDQEAEAIHDEGGTHTDVRRGRAKSETYYYFNIRNRLVYAAKHATDDELRQWQRSALRVSYEILLQGGRTQFLRSPAPLRALVSGIRDGRKFVQKVRGA